MSVTTHDVIVDDTTFILEWTHTDDGTDYIAITEGCNDQPESCEWFVNKATTPSWCCNTHMFDGTGDYPATGEHPEDCDFKDDEECDGMHETHDFQEVA